MLEELWNGDCLELMKNIPDKSVDMILCDLPYAKIRAKWDTPINLEMLWEEYFRIRKDNTPILLFGDTPFDKILGVSNIDELKYEWIWEKTQATGYYNAKKMPMKAHENILVFYKTPPTYNPQKTTGHSPINSYTKRVDVCNKTEVYGKVKVDMSGGGETDRYPRTVQVFPSDKQKNKSTGFMHPTQKPIALCEYLIKTYSNEGDLVLDNCMGSGTTCLAAKNLGRQFIGIEKDKEYFNICVERLK
jgi:site-specific DNA-methyltransferase (adenine-specific)